MGFGPFFDIDRPLEENQFLSMSLAQYVDMETMALKIMELNKKLIALNDKSLKEKTKTGKLLKKFKELAAQREVIDGKDRFRDR